MSLTNHLMDLLKRSAKAIAAVMVGGGISWIVFANVYERLSMEKLAIAASAVLMSSVVITRLLLAIWNPFGRDHRGTRSPQNTGVALSEHHSSSESYQPARW
jgi:hypothetical protein